MPKPAAPEMHPPTLRSHAVRMAHYNAWMNAKLYAAARTLDGQTLALPRGAFFGSIHGTLHHIYNADIIWLKRFAGLPGPHAVLDPVRALSMPTALDAETYPEFDALAAHRAELDALIESWTGALTDDDLATILDYANTRGERFSRELSGLLMHFFNHQTHHRGQATTLLTQAGVDVGVTDLLVLLPTV